MSEFQNWTSQHRTIRKARDWNALLDHGLEKSASYIIRKNGDYYEAINGSTGKIDYGGANNAGGVNGSDAAAVIQATIGVIRDLQSDSFLIGGKILLKSGKYVINSTLVIDTVHISFEGEQPYTRLEAGSDIPLLQIKKTANTPASITGDLYGVNLKNLHLVGILDGSSNVLEATDLYLSVFENLYIEQGKRGLELTNFHENMIINLHCEDQKWEAVNLNSGSLNTFIGGTVSSNRAADYALFRIKAASHKNKLIGLKVWKACGHGIIIEGHRNEIIGVTSKDNSQNPTSTYSALILIDAVRNIILGGAFYDEQITPTQAHGIKETGASNYNYIIANRFEGNVVSGITIVGANTKIHNNIGFVTKNCGTTIIPANTRSYQVSFEMAGTPTVVKVTPEFNVSGQWWISNRNWASGTSILSGAFTFNRTYSGLYSGIIHWNAEYIP